jgi:antitoxin PrlF
MGRCAALAALSTACPQWKSALHLGLDRGDAMNAIMPMTGLTVTAKGQITLKKDLLQHLGVQPGGQIEVEKLPNGEMRLRAKKPTGTIASFCGFLKREGQRPVSIEEMSEAIAKGWAGLS